MDELNLTTKQMIYYNSKKKNIIVAYLLGAVFGSFGAHAFYVGGDYGAVLGVLSIAGFIYSFSDPTIFMIYGLFVLSGVLYTYFLVKHRNQQLMKEVVGLIGNDE